MGLVCASGASDSHGIYIVYTIAIAVRKQNTSLWPLPVCLQTGERRRGFDRVKRRRTALPVAAVGLAGAEDEREGEAVVALGADRLERRGAHALADLRSVAGEHLVQAPRAEHG